VPVDTKVRVLLTAQDVIHAWWVPDFGMKKDAIPGFVNEMWFKVDADKPGTYRGQCAELCGRDHGFMPVVVKVSKDDDSAEFAQQKAGRAAEGRQAAAGTEARRAAAARAPPRPPPPRSAGRDPGRRTLKPVAARG
jgi:cytochrome c oxidase subunit 2